MDDLFTWLILLFIILPLLEGLLRKGRGAGKGGVPPGERPRSQRGPSARQSTRRPHREEGPAARRPAEVASPAPADGDSGIPWWERQAGEPEFAEVPGGSGAGPEPEGIESKDASVDIRVPDDLWEILTGQRPPWEVPEEPQPSTADRDEERAEWDAGGDGAAGGGLEGDVPGREAGSGEIGSSHEAIRSGAIDVEEPPLPPISVHRRIPAPPIPRERVRKPGYRFRDADDLRRAIVLREILGPPVGLRPPGDDLPR